MNLGLGDVLRALRRNPVGWVGLGFLLLLVLAAVLAPWLAPYDPHQRVGRPFQPPSAQHLLGTNDVGHDIFSEVVWGTRVSLTVGLVAAAIAMLVGTAAGVVAGYYGGWVDGLLMRLVDVVLVIPFLPLMILLAAYLGPSLGNTVAVIGLLTWATPARVIRSAVLTARERDYVAAARALGAREGRILWRHVLPAALPVALAQFIRATSGAILIEASLAFLGLGDPTQKSWGTVLYYAQVRGAFLTGSWAWWVLPPGLLITCTVLAFALTGYALEEVVNPRLRGMGRAR